MYKHHIVFIPKDRRKMMYHQYKADLQVTLCAYAGVEVLEGHLKPGHVHMLVSVQPKLNL